MGNQVVSEVDAAPKAAKRPLMTIHRAKDAKDVDAELMPYLGLTSTDEAGIAKASAAGTETADFVRLLFENEEAGMSLTYAWFKPNFVLPRHSHNADCAYYVISGEVHLGTEVLKAGDVFFVPCDHTYTYIAGPEGVEVMEFRTASSFHIKFTGNSGAYWSRLANVIGENQSNWAAAKPPLAAQRMMGKL